MWPVIIFLTILSIEKRLSSEILAWKGLSCSLYLLPKIDMELINLLSLMICNSLLFILISILSSSKWKCDCNIDKKKIKCPWSIVYRLVFLLQTRLADRGILIYCVIIQCKSHWWFSCRCTCCLGNNVKLKILVHVPVNYQSSLNKSLGTLYRYL